MARIFVGAVTLPHGRGIDFFSYYMAARVPMTGHSPYEHGVIDYEHPVFHDDAVEHFSFASRRLSEVFRDVTGEDA